MTLYGMSSYHSSHPEIQQDQLSIEKEINFEMTTQETTLHISRERKTNTHKMYACALVLKFVSLFTRLISCGYRSNWTPLCLFTITIFLGKDSFTRPFIMVTIAPTGYNNSYNNSVSCRPRQHAEVVLTKYNIRKNIFEIGLVFSATVHFYP